MGESTCSNIWGEISLVQTQKTTASDPLIPSQPGIPRPLEVQEGSEDGSMGYLKYLNLNWRYFRMTKYGVKGVNGCCQTCMGPVSFGHTDIFSFLQEVTL